MRHHVIFAAALLPLAVLGCRSPQASDSAATVIHAPARPAQPALSASAEDVPTTLYRDTLTGVSFRYPSVWRSGPPADNNLPSPLTGDPSVTLREIVIFSPEGNLYQKTDLSQLNFLFAIAKADSAAACHDLVARNGELNSPATIITNPAGISFTEAQGSDGAAGHLTSFTLDSTFRNGRCLVFARDEEVLSPGVQEGSLPLTSAQERALQHHLASIFNSVTLP